MKKLLTVLFFLVLSALFITVQAQDSRAETNKTIGISAKGIPAEEIAVISGSYSIDSSGTVNMPYLKSPLHVAGKTGRQIENMLAAEYKKQEIFTTPIFVVNISTDEANITTQFVQVSGYVGSKRSVPYRKGLTLLAAVLDAGDITEFGSGKIQLTRNGKTETYDYFSNKDRNILLKPDDAIFVPARGIFEGRPPKLRP